MSGSSERPSQRISRRLRPILPADGPSSWETLRSPGQTTIRVPVPTACDPCRKSKAKCSGERPACRRCARRRIPCTYVAQPGETPSQALNRSYRNLQNRAAAHEELVELLRKLPDSEAQTVLRNLRSGTDVSTIIDHVKVGSALLQMAVSPETRLRYEFPYRAEMPEEYVLNNPYLSSLIYEAASLYPEGQSPNMSPPTRNKLLRNQLEAEEYRSLYFKPFHAAQLMDARLDEVKISSWTTVCKNDLLMRDLLRVFLRCEYQFTAAFQKDLFLEDMASQGHDFCSPLLVNLLLAYSCICYPPFKDRAEYWNPQTLTYRFFMEARRLWELESSEPRITTIQSGILFSVFYNLSGLDVIGQAYRVQAVALAHELRIFDKVPVGSDERVQRGWAFTAWTLFNWETLVGFSFMLQPLLNKPPEIPLPHPSTNSEWYGELWVNYPLNQHLSPMYFGHVFKARSEFRVIMNDFCQTAYAEDSSVTLAKATELRLRLQQWYDDLPTPLQPRAIVLPAHMQLHMYCYHLLLTIFEPLLDTGLDQEVTPQHIVAEASKYLHTLIRLYYLRHGFEAMDLFIVIPLMLAASDCVDAIGDHTPAAQLETLRSTLVLAAKGLSSQRRNHYLAEALFRVIRGRMRPQEVSLLRESMDPEEEETEEKRGMMQAVRSHWPVSVVKKREEMDSHILTNLVESYGHLNVE